ncbi:MAG TPA: hypothetical protein VF461_01565 [Gemmatimonadaceae bacterium]
MTSHGSAQYSQCRTAWRRRGLALCVGAALLTPSITSASTVVASRRGTSATSYIDAHRSAPSRALLAALANVNARIPSFSRQTGLACSTCHYQFPQLTPFGRLFKMNGYTLTSLKRITAGDSTRPSLALSPIPPVSAMLVASLTQLNKAEPAAQNSSVMFPEQLSVFLGGAITPKVGTFIQFTYAAQDGTFGMDNLDVRYATHTAVLEKDVLFGLTVNNNPTVQDPWNTVPAWTFPFMSSSIAPTPIASTLIDGNLAQQVLGLGAYALWNNTLYTEFTAYRSAQQGTPAPLDSASQNVISQVIPYSRVALQHTWDKTYLMVGGFGFLGAHLFPTGVTGETDHFTTLGVDAQVERQLGTTGAMLIGRTSFIHEKQFLDATFGAEEAQNQRANLETYRANVSYLPNIRLGATVGYFNTSGSVDTLRYAPAELTGSRTGSPNTDGFLGELSFNPWQNLRLSLQYTAYHRFNGSSDAYDVLGGRQASNNNTLYLYTWVAF